MAKPIDLTGETFSRLLVIEPHGRNRFGSSQWLCQCSCGNLTVADTHSLKSGHKRSCGCLMRECTGNMRRIDGRSSDKLYHLYYNIRSRCENPKTPHFDCYGGRGIKVCEEWKNWGVFREWALSHGYEQGLTIDRIDVNGDYEPNNCRWITRAEQMRNTRKTRHLTYKGITKPLKSWCEELGVSFNSASARFTRGWGDAEEILFGRKRGINNG